MVLFLLYVLWNNNVESRTRNSTVMRDLSHDPSRPQGLGCRGVVKGTDLDSGVSVMGTVTGT